MQNSEKMDELEFLANFDRIQNEEERRENGKFYTPKLLVELAHFKIAKCFGVDWKEHYAVWDNSCGTGNLTRGYRFRDLYLSTNDEAELAHVKASKEGTAFSFDFLNDPIYENAWLKTKSLLPETLWQVLRNDEPLMFFMNPPYAKGASYGTGAIKQTSVNKRMKALKMGQGAANLYAQFIFRILEIKRHFNLTKCVLALFSPTLLFTGGSFSLLRKELFKDFNYLEAAIFSAKHFSDTAKHWAVGFSLWSSGSSRIRNNFPAKIIDWGPKQRLAVIGEKLLYNTDGAKPANLWLREQTKGRMTMDAPNLTSALKIKQSGIRRGKSVEGALGYFYSNSNNIEKNPINVALFSSPFSAGEGVSVIEENFERCVSLFAARKLVKNTWINNKDEYFAPNEEHELWPEFVNDSTVFSLFHSASNQSSMRQIRYKDEFWDIKNHFFFMSMNALRELALAHANAAILEDLEGDSERYVYQRIMASKLSVEAQNCYDFACHIVRESFPYRRKIQEQKPELHLNTWDASWYQIKRLASESIADSLEGFKEVFASLSEKMLAMVYTIGFLR
ncbi:MAG: hypothetical protein ACOX8U_02290 [Bradymonadia bacterium]